MTAPADLTCAVFVEDELLADDAESYLADIPTALAGLSLTWGRDTQVDQPATSTLTFEVAERAGKRPIYDLIHVGYRVHVEVGEADEEVPPGTEIDVAVDGVFLSPIPERARPGVQSTAVINRFTSWGGWGQSGWILQGSIAATLPASYEPDGWLIPPAPFTPVTTGWDAIPTVTPGQDWQLRFQYSALFGMWTGQTYPPVMVQPVLFTSPLATGGYQYLGSPTALPQRAPTAASIEITVPITIPPGVPRGWLGLAVFSRPRVTWNTYAVPTEVWTDLLSWLQWRQMDDGAQFFRFQVLHVAGGIIRRQYLAFSGRITDVEIRGAQQGSSIWAITASDWTADMENDNIGDEPWPEQSIQARMNRIQQLASVPFSYDMDPIMRPLQVTYRDVDAQPVMGLLRELTVSADTVLWPMFTNARGSWLWFEDMALRESLGALVFDSASNSVIIEWHRYHPRNAIVISACDIRRDAPSFAQTVEDLLTRVDATWQEQTVNDEGVPEPTERYVHVYDPLDEQTYGVRAASVSTQLSTQAACIDTATRILMRQVALRWRTLNLEWDTGLRGQLSADRRADVRALLDGGTRQGLPIVILDLPEWSPDYPEANYYLEGGTYSYQRGRWTLELHLSPSEAIGYSVTWSDLLTAWRWIDFDIAVEWRQLWGLSTAVPIRRRAARQIVERPMGSVMRNAS